MGSQRSVGFRFEGPISMTGRSRFVGIAYVVQHQPDHQLGRLPGCPAPSVRHTTRIPRSPRDVRGFLSVTDPG